ncbi:zinc-finger domain-containing protein [Methylophaga thalassica]|uniref:zinc-finger domain-containing protein n=1 Tax=Methylophaga aminisulfidivorans TaxID=230105 RepID=UPI003A902D2B
MGEQSNDKSCTEKHYWVHPKDLPLSCPMPDMSVWNAHPRVYLDIETKGEVACPYCSALFTLSGQD